MLKRKRPEDVHCLGCECRVVAHSQKKGRCDDLKCDPANGRWCTPCTNAEPERVKKPKVEEATRMCEFCCLDSFELGLSGHYLKTYSAGKFWCCTLCDEVIHAELCMSCALQKKCVDPTHTCDLQTCGPERRCVYCMKAIDKAEAKKAKEQKDRDEKANNAVRIGAGYEYISRGWVAEEAVDEIMKWDGQEKWLALCRADNGPEMAWAAFNAMRGTVDDLMGEIAMSAQAAMGEYKRKGGGWVYPNPMDEIENGADNWMKVVKEEMIKDVAECALAFPGTDSENEGESSSESESDSDDGEFYHDADCGAKPGQMCACGLSDSDLEIKMPALAPKKAVETGDSNSDICRRVNDLTKR